MRFSEEDFSDKPISPQAPVIIVSLSNACLTSLERFRDVQKVLQGFERFGDFGCLET